MTKQFKVLSILLSMLFAGFSFAGPLDFSEKFTTDAAEVVQLQRWKGKKVVFAMLYPKCTSACPLILGKLKAIRESLEASGTKAEFILVSFDSVDESAKRLKDYKAHMKLEWPNWTFLFGKEKDIRFLSNSVNIRYWQNPKSKDISHDNVILLINEKGEVHRRIEGLDAEIKELF
jgi:protein SCO1/2